MVRTAVGIVEEEGLRNLWSGVTPAILRHIVYTGSRMTAYEFLRNKVLKRNPGGRISYMEISDCGNDSWCIWSVDSEPNRSSQGSNADGRKKSSCRGKTT
ncbi:hypothetical protein OS493_019906 [Desmophyllum pertusum]|uniref:Mitochondrial carrier protein n=1 Tax=Desmophyllum pertusum TaxID=174260 RepID=A0A9W9YN71_9CNID|nr:hypothetical protein OS493_019906 [Desmophyllum pertusum]